MIFPTRKMPRFEFLSAVVLVSSCRHSAPAATETGPAQVENGSPEMFTPAAFSEAQVVEYGFWRTKLATFVVFSALLPNTSAGIHPFVGLVSVDRQTIWPFGAFTAST